MNYPDIIKKTEFFKKYKRNINGRHTMFQGRKALMEELYAQAPIYCDQTYYVQEKELHRVKKEGDHFKCDVYDEFENWRDCHYYTEYEDAEGNKVWLMTGGRYD